MFGYIVLFWSTDIPFNLLLSLSQILTLFKSLPPQIIWSNHKTFLEISNKTNLTFICILLCLVKCSILFDFSYLLRYGFLLRLLISFGLCLWIIFRLIIFVFKMEFMVDVFVMAIIIMIIYTIVPQHFLRIHFIWE